jgi:hypothetical protein
VYVERNVLEGFVNFVRLVLSWNSKRNGHIILYEWVPVGFSTRNFTPWSQEIDSYLLPLGTEIGYCVKRYLGLSVVQGPAYFLPQIKTFIELTADHHPSALSVLMNA